jgi:hypothetical protein
MLEFGENEMGSHKIAFIKLFQEYLDNMKMENKDCYFLQQAKLPLLESLSLSKYFFDGRSKLNRR